MTKYKVGDLVRTKYPARTVLVTERDPDLKNDKPGYVGILMTGHGKGMPTWGYDEEVGAVFPGSAKRLAEGRALEHSYVSQKRKKTRRADAIRKAKYVATDPGLWLVGACVAAIAFVYWRNEKATPSTVGTNFPPL